MFSRNYARDIMFDNGYGVSISCNELTGGFSRGLFEIALLDGNGDIIHDHPLMGHNGVIGWLDFENVVDVLNQIKALPAVNNGALTGSFMQAHGCREGQMRGIGHRVHNGGWYNAAGQKIGWGDLDDKDLERLAENMPRNGVLFILGEHDSFWKFVTYNPGICGDLCQTSADEKTPGTDYMLDKAMIVIVADRWYWVDRWGYDTAKNDQHAISEEKMRELVTPLLCQPETA